MVDLPEPAAPEETDPRVVRRPPATPGPSAQAEDSGESEKAAFVPL